MLQPQIVVLAAGLGKRMRSSRPKVLHTLGGRPLLAHVLETAAGLAPEHCIVVYGHGGDAVPAAFAGRPGLRWVEQSRQLGTGHAVAQALPLLRDEAPVLVLYGDVPLLPAAPLHRLLEAADAGQLALLTTELHDPTGYGRILRDTAGRVVRIVEHKDASADERLLREVNTGILAAPGGRLRDWLGRLDNDNAQGEYYLTDCVALAVAEGRPVTAIRLDDAREAQGINDRLQLAGMERLYQQRQAEALMCAGATVLDPARLDIRGRVDNVADTLIDVNVVFEGEVTLAPGVEIGPNCLIRDAVLEEGTVVLANSVIEGARVGPFARIGPFARLRPGTRLAAHSHVGNFVETKNTALGEGSKANHLSYLGDAEIGTGVNVGAGTITCNYDGARKHTTVIEDEVFIGSNSALVAPIRIGRGATVGAGSTLSRDVAPGSLTLNRAPRKELSDWRRPRKTED